MWAKVHIIVHTLSLQNPKSAQQIVIVQYIYWSVYFPQHFVIGGTYIISVRIRCP